MLTLGFTLHPTDEDLSVGTPALGYFHILPDGRIGEAGMDHPPSWILLESRMIRFCCVARNA
jgi:hypothetical protein